MCLKNLHMPKLVVSLILPFLAAFIGSVFTSPSIPTWYASLNKPFISPPNWIFAPVWTALYLLMGIAAYMVWNKGVGKGWDSLKFWRRKKDEENIRTSMYLFVTQLVFNALWSILFFGLRSPVLAFWEIIVLWVLIMATSFRFYEVDKKAGILMVPYILWVSFAAFLNLNIWILNM